MKKWLKDKTIIITGASSGFGKELTKLFISKMNAKVIGVARNKDKMDALVKELGDSSKNFSYQLFDVSKEENWINFANYLKDNNIVPTLVINNAGMLNTFNNYLSIGIEKGKQIMDTNFYSVVYSSNYILPLTEEKGGMVNISSSDALISVAGTNYYGASKAAVKAWSQSLQYEFRDKYIACILPGFTDTNIFRDANMSSKDQKRMKKLISPCDKIAKKIYKAIIKRKKYKIVGYDAHVFNFLSKVCPNTGTKIINGILNKAKVDMFSGVYNNKM